MGSDLELVEEHEKVQFEQSTELGGNEGLVRRMK